VASLFLLIKKGKVDESLSLGTIYAVRSDCKGEPASVKAVKKKDRKTRKAYKRQKKNKATE